MKCSRCNSERIQRDYDDAFALVRLAGMRKLLCNDCGHVFLGFDPMGKVRRKPTRRDSRLPNRRRTPRFKSHLPTSISLITRESSDAKVTYSAPSQGHCEAINETGMGLSLVGSRFHEADLTRPGRLVLVSVRLPDATVEAVVSVLNSHRFGQSNTKKWYLGTEIHQIDDDDRANLIAYLKKRQLNEPLINVE